MGLHEYFRTKGERHKKSTALVTHSVHADRPLFWERHKTGVIQIRHSLVVFLPVEAEKCEGLSEADIRGAQESAYIY